MSDKVKVTFFEDFAGAGSFGNYSRGDQAEIEQDRAISLNHRKIVIFGHHKLTKSGKVAKEDKFDFDTKEEKSPKVTKASISE